MKMETIYFEKRKYARDEIAIILELDPKDKKFAQKVRNRLENLGMEEGEDFLYTRKDVTILWVPVGREEKIVYLVRLLGIDKQIDAQAFATFVYAMLEFPEYQKMPWAERTKLMNETYDLNISEVTYKRWMSKLIALRIMFKDKNDSSIWCTMYIDGERKRFEVENEEDEAHYKTYLQRKFALYQELKNWDMVFKTLWSEFHCVYYKCGSFIGNAWADNQIIHELLDLISGYAEEEK